MHQLLIGTVNLQHVTTTFIKVKNTSTWLELTKLRTLLTLSTIYIKSFEAEPNRNRPEVIYRPQLSNMVVKEIQYLGHDYKKKIINSFNN